MKDQDAHYLDLFGSNPMYSTAYPNVEESRRWAKISEYLSAIAEESISRGRQPRILDVGCGRGWMTGLASVYGQCDGLDPVSSVIDLARGRHPHLTFYAATLDELAAGCEFDPYDAVICSEVIEHVEDKPQFASHLRQCLAPQGHLIVTSPRAEWFGAYRRAGYHLQPIEEWLTEAEMRETFEGVGLATVDHDRIYEPLPGMSLLHTACASKRISAMLDRGRLTWLAKGLMHMAAIYQVWWFRVPAE